MAASVLRVGLRKSFQVLEIRQIRFNTGNEIASNTVPRIALDIFPKQAAKTDDATTAMKSPQSTGLAIVSFASGLLSGVILFLGQELRADIHELRMDVLTLQSQVNALHKGASYPKSQANSD